MTLEGRRLGSGVKAPTKNVGVNSAMNYRSGSIGLRVSTKRLT